MKPVITSLILPALAFVFLSFQNDCSSSKEKPSADKPVQAVQPAEPSVQAVENVPATVDSPETKQEAVIHTVQNYYRLIVSFISIGEGTDQKAFEELTQFADQKKKEQKTDIISEQFHWGREGEVDVCFRLEELKYDERQKFAEGVKKLFKDNKLVLIEENAVCRHIR